MNIVPNTTCRRCHRQYPAFRSRCPYCGTKKTKTVRTAVPETDSAVPSTPAAKSAAEAVNMQMLLGAVLLLAVIILTIVVVSVNINKDVGAQQEIQNQIEAEAEITPPAPPTPTPSPQPSPAPQVTNVSIAWDGRPGYEYNGSGFWGSVGQTYQMKVTWFPQEVLSIPEWTSSDEEVATVDDTGLITLVGEGDATVTVKVTDDPRGSGTCPIHVSG